MHDPKQRRDNNKDTPGLSINRKTFLKSSALSLIALSPMGNLGFNFTGKHPNPTKARNSNDDNILRTIEYNIFNGAIGYKGFNDTKPFPDESDYQLVRAAREMDQVPRRLALQLELYKPDIISFCESATEETIKEMAKWLNMNYAYFPSSKYKGSYPGTILTHWPIVSSKNRPFVGSEGSKDLFTRHWGKAAIRLPNEEIITVHSAHLWPFTANGGKAIRLAEIEELLKSIHYDLDHNTKSVILQGDMNLTPESDEYKKLIEGELVDAFTKVEQGIEYTATSKDPHVRIDYIFAIGTIAEKLATYRPLYEGAFRMYPDDPKSWALSDHIPSLCDFQI
jgi:endonuclease/exonuclease/phosphatase family metal-dependent hydrolase